jgi:hypothetical protein
MKFELNDTQNNNKQDTESYFIIAMLDVVKLKAVMLIVIAPFQKPPQNG